MHYRVRYSLDFDLKIRSSQVWYVCMFATVKLYQGWSPSGDDIIQHSDKHPSMTSHFFWPFLTYPTTYAILLSKGDENQISFILMVQRLDRTSNMNVL